MAQRAIYGQMNPETVRRNHARVQEEIASACARAGRDPDDVQVLVATKYIAAEAMEALAEAGIPLVGENRAQDLLTKHAIYGDRFTWDFIGHLQSNKIRQIMPLVRLIHSVDTLSAVAEIDRRAAGKVDVLLQVNVGKEGTKYGIIPSEVDRFLEEASRFSKVNFSGLMTMPPLVADPEAVRPVFAALSGLASELSQKWHGQYQFKQLSMGTSRDFSVAVEEGATIVRIGGALFG